MRNEYVPLSVLCTLLLLLTRFLSPLGYSTGAADGASPKGGSLSILLEFIGPEVNSRS
jgi:hypothetical protein